MSPFSTATRQTISDLGTIAVVVAFLWMLLFKIRPIIPVGVASATRAV